MRRRRHHILNLLCLCGFLLIACEDGGEETGEPVATFGDYTLTDRELARQIPPGLAADDSLEFARNYIENWILHHALAQAALEKNPEAEQLIAHELEYHRSILLAEQWRDEVLATQLDTVVTFEEVDQYYKNNIEQFTAEDNLYQFYYVRTDEPETTPQLRQRLGSEDAEDRRIIKEWAEENADRIKYDERYLGPEALQTIQQNFPNQNLAAVPPGSPVAVSANFVDGKKIVYFFFMRDVIRKGEPLPIERVAVEIRQLLLNKRKNQLLETAEQNLLEEAYAQDATIHAN